MITEIGIKFSINEQFGRQEHQVYNSLKQQIEEKFPLGNNLIVNLTWFGPQFDNHTWQSINQLINENKRFDRIFWIDIVDPVPLLPDQILDLENKLQVREKYYLGPAFSGKHSFNTASIVCYEDFPPYLKSDLLLTNAKFLYLNYNRKPKPHRIRLVELLHENNLEKYGIVTLGKNDVTYDVSLGNTTAFYLTINDSTDYTHNGKFPKHNNFGGVPNDLCSLGNVDIWQNHFLNIVSETEFFPWDATFVTEKTWKPIIGLRPFVLNGQTKIYKYLRDNGFNTFNHYWPHIEMEELPEFKVHDSLIEVIRFLSTLSSNTLLEMYTDMLPALEHNRNRFFEFAKEQQHKINHIFK